MTGSAFKQTLGFPESARQLQQQQQQLPTPEEVSQNLGGKTESLPFAPFTPEWKEYYYKMIEENEGFDLGDLPSNLDTIGLITPLRNLNHSLPLLEKASKSAIALFNKQNGKKYKFVEVIRANAKLVSGFFFYITFAAEDKDVGSLKNFQALVYSKINEVFVKFCRLEPQIKGSAVKGGQSKAKLEADSKVSSRKRGTGTEGACKMLAIKVCPEEDPDKPKRPPTTIFCFMEKAEKLYKEKYPDASSDDVGRACRRKWISMSDREKAPYVEEARGKAAEYYKNLEAYNKRMAEGLVEEGDSGNLRKNESSRS
ncbi:hypothetical protein Vadar_022426 [Vaccinium darrowii]|uniref:Uncharacterized protein n=1 Tax=Vaccinium darrowii TaxID=229202 RepID=A0ACB7YYI0_9ERIC|nr:hypothetical protein Vadar_022426 [Vaccinium darrowii]